MGFKITWDSDQIIRDLRSATAQVCSPYNDGFSSWRCKQDLIKIKYALEEMLNDAPTFAGEEEYIAKLEKEKTWKLLNRQNI